MSMKDRKPAERRSLMIASAVIIVAFSAWVAVQNFGGQFGLTVRHAVLADMLCLVALGWALWVIFNVWRIRAKEGK